MKQCVHKQFVSKSVMRKKNEGLGSIEKASIQKQHPNINEYLNILFSLHVLLHSVLPNLQCACSIVHYLQLKVFSLLTMFKMTWVQIFNNFQSLGIKYEIPDGEYEEPELEPQNPHILLQNLHIDEQLHATMWLPDSSFIDLHVFTCAFFSIGSISADFKNIFNKQIVIVCIMYLWGTIWCFDICLRC